VPCAFRLVWCADECADEFERVVDLWTDSAEPVIGAEPGSRPLQETAKELSGQRRREAMEWQELAERDYERTRPQRGNSAQVTDAGCSPWRVSRWFWGVSHAAASISSMSCAPRSASAERSTTTKKTAARPAKARRRHVGIAGYAGQQWCAHRSSYHLFWRLAAWYLPVPRVITLSAGRTSPGWRSGSRSTRLYQGPKSILASSSNSARSPRTK
jgi:hypothetical protein